MAKKKDSAPTAVVPYDEELARLATEGAAQERLTGSFYGTAGGVLTWGGANVPGSRLLAVILDGIHENIYYKDKFNSQKPANPLCFAVGREEEKLEPHELVVKANQAQADTCAECRFNEWESADTGRGKACKNIRRLAILTAAKLERGGAKLITDPEHYEAASVGYLRVPVTSVKNYSALVQQLYQSAHLPVFGAYVEIIVAPDLKNQFSITFNPVEPVPDELLPVLLKRHKEQREKTGFGVDADQTAAKPTGEKTGARGKKKGGRY